MGKVVHVHGKREDGLQGIEEEEKGHGQFFKVYSLSSSAFG